METIFRYFVCDICENIFKWKKHLYAHKRNVHNIEPQLSVHKKLKCHYCDLGSSNFKELRNHLVEAHNFNVHQKTLEFKNFQEFNSWKNTVEKEFRCYYIKKDKKVSSNSIIRYFNCHRQQNRKRKLKLQGSCKLNSTCPSTIKVEENRETGLLKTIIWYPHTHEKSLGNTKFTEGERAYIAEKLTTRILDDDHTDLNIKNVMETRLIQKNEVIRDRVKEKINYLYTTLTEDDKILLSIEKKIDAVITISNKSKKTNIPANVNNIKEPANKHIDRQITFTSTKKERTSNVKSLRKPTSEEKTSYKKKLLSQVLSEHSYSNKKFCD